MNGWIAVDVVFQVIVCQTGFFWSRFLGGFKTAGFPDDSFLCLVQSSAGSVQRHLVAGEAKCLGFVRPS